MGKSKLRKVVIAEGTGLYYKVFHFLCSTGNVLEKTYVGLGVEYAQEEGKYDDLAPIDYSRYTTMMIIAYIEVGYRWLFEYFHIGIGASFALSVWTRGERLLDDGSTKTKQYDPMPMPQLNLEIGFAL